MALVRGSDPVAGPSRWLPTHVQVTVLRARGLRGKSSAGSTSDAYTVIQLGREKYSTSVVEKTPGCPEWREECSFELPPGALDSLLRAQETDAGPAPWAAGPTAVCALVLTTMHRSLIGVDKFLGQATVALDEVFAAGRAQHTEWYKLHSKTGKKEKERGEIQVTIQFTRHNLSASMFDLSAKDKPRSPFSKIKDKMKGKKRFDLESASAILPSSAPEDPDLGGLGRMGKAKGFFLRNKLRRSSLSQSNTSLGSDSTLSSASGNPAFQGPPELLTRSPSRSSWLSTDGGKDSTQSPKLFTHKRTFSDEASQLRAGPRGLLDLQAHLDSGSRSSLCVNGSHVYNDEPPQPPRHRGSISGPFPASGSQHSVAPRPSEDDLRGRGSRSASSSDVVPRPEEASTQPAALAVGAGHSSEEVGARLPEGKPVQVATPMVASSEAGADKEGARKEERKPRMGLFHHPPGLSWSELGRRSSLGEKGGPTLGTSPHHSSSGEEKAKSSWFGLREPKEPTQKPSASRASPPPQAAPGKGLPEWDDTFNVFAASRLCPEALAPAGMGPEAAGLQALGPEAAGLQALGPKAVTVEVPRPQGQPEGRGQAGSNVWPESVMPVDLGLACQGASTVDVGPFQPLGATLPTPAAWPPTGASDDTGPGEEPPASGEDPGQSPSGSPTSLFSSPEVISVWERLPGPDDTPEGQDQEASGGASQLFPELSTASDAWPWDVVTISPAPEASSPVLQAGSEELPAEQVQPESPEAVRPQDTEGLLLEPAPEVTPERGSEEQGMPPPKPPRLFIPGHSQQEEEEEEEAAGALPDWRPEKRDDTSPNPPAACPQEAEEEDEKLESEGSDGHSSGTLLDELSRKGVGEEASPPPSPACLSLPTSPKGPLPSPAYSESLAFPGPQIWGALEQGEAPDDLETRSQGPAREELGPMPARSQQTDLWVSEEDTFLSRESRDPPSLPSTSPPGSRESSILSGPEEPPTPPEPAFPPPPLPLWAGHLQAGLSPEGASLPGAWPLASPSPPQGGPASSWGPGEPSPAEGSPTPLRDDHAAATPASPLVLLPLETRPVEELQPGASPHPVKPLSATPTENSPDRKPPRSSLSTALSSGLEKLKTVTSGGVQPVAPAPQVGQAVEGKRLKDGTPDQSARYYHLTHDELIGLLLQRERELSQRDEHVQELESYIDRLLVRIMETSPTLLQIPAMPPK